jgi:hypothetical protein
MASTEPNGSGVPEAPRPIERSGLAALAVGSGILLSLVIGLVQKRVLAT